MRGLRRRFFAALHARPGLRQALLLGPGIAFLALFFVAPIALMFAYSFLQRDPLGGVSPGLQAMFVQGVLHRDPAGVARELTLEHYLRFADPLYLKILARTLGESLLCTLVSLVLGYPLAYAIAASKRWRSVLMFLVVLPFWTSFLVRTFALIFLLRPSGLVNTALQAVGLIEEPLTLLYTPGAVLFGLVYGFVPFMVLPIYASLEKLDPSLLEAAEVLGARPLTRFLRITLPLSLPGVVAGSLLVFVPALGSFLTSDLLGGAKEMLLGNVIQNQFGPARNWPFGAASSFVMTLLVLAALWVYLRARDRERR